MRSTTPALLAVTFAMFLAACGGDDDGGDRTEPDPSTNAGAGAGTNAAAGGGMAEAGRAAAGSGSGGRGGTAGTSGSGAAGSGGRSGASGAGGTTGTSGRGGTSGAAGAGGMSAGRGGSGGMGASGAGTGGAAGMPASGDGLRIDGNRILGPDGKPFHGRGANLSDTRSCDACAWQQPDPTGLNRWADALIDDWKANFIRFNLTSFAESGGRMQWKSVLEDPQYLADIETNVAHMTAKPGVYVMLTVFIDPSMKYGNQEQEGDWPSAMTIPVYEALANTFHDNPKVLFGLCNEPHGPANRNPDLAARYLAAIDAIRKVEKMHGAPEHVVVVQAPQQWARYLEYFIDNPIDRSNIAYEVHAYNPQSDFKRLITDPSMTLPILIGEYGPADSMTNADIMAMWTLLKQREIPHIAWAFHMRCPPNLLENSASDGCGLAAQTNYDFPRTSWGDLFYTYMQTPW
jgi:hypothetical protein